MYSRNFVDNHGNRDVALTFIGLFRWRTHRRAQLQKISAGSGRLGQTTITADGAVAGTQKPERESRCSTRQTSSKGKAPPGEQTTKPDKVPALVYCLATSFFPLVNSLYAF